VCHTYKLDHLSLCACTHSNILTSAERRSERRRRDPQCWGHRLQGTVSCRRNSAAAGICTVLHIANYGRTWQMRTSRNVHAAQALTGFIFLTCHLCGYFRAIVWTFCLLAHGRAWNLCITIQRSGCRPSFVVPEHAIRGKDPFCSNCIDACILHLVLRDWKVQKWS
jgi:hypothetical protein